MKSYIQILLLCFAYLLTGSRFINGQNISTRAEIYDFDVGDIYHISWSAHGGEVFFESLTNMEIIDKYFSPDSNSVFYVRDISYMERSSYDITWDYEYYVDTICFSELDYLINDGLIDTVYSDENEYNGRLINFYSDTINDHVIYKRFVAGCGLARDFAHAIPLWQGGSQKDLEYFKKGDEEWGSPFYVSVNEVHKLSEKVLIYPNPLSTTLHVNFYIPGDYMVEVYSPAGQKVDEKIYYNSIHGSIDFTSMTKGIYFVRLTSGNKSLVRKIVKR